MRSIRLLTLALSISTITHVAAAQATTPAHPTSQAEPREGKERMERMHDQMFKGIALSTDEKAKVKAIHEKYRAEGKQLMAAGRPAREEAAADRKRGDNPDAIKAMAKNKENRDEMREMRGHAESDIREALSPEHRAQFDANVKDMKERHEARVEKREEKREEKHERQRDAKADRAGTPRP